MELPAVSGEFEVLVPESQIPTKRVYAPLPGKILRFIECFVACRDLEQAAERCGLPPSQGIKLWKRGRIRREIIRRLRVVEQALAHQTAEAISLRVELLDSELVEAVKMPVMPGMASAKVGALKLAYGRLGIPTDPSENKDNKPPSAPAEIYNWVFQQKRQSPAGETVTQTVAVEGRAPLELPMPTQQQPRDRNEQILLEIDEELKD